MFNHLLGRGHREKFFGNKYETDYEKVNSHKILQMAQKERENKNIEFITTIYSDELYPWLSGKAPWSLEQGQFFHILFILTMPAAVRTKNEYFSINQWEVYGSNIWHHSPSVVLVQ